MKRFFNWLFLLCLIGVIISIISLVIIEFILKIKHPEYTEMIIFFKLYKYYFIPIGFVGLCIILEYINHSQ
jgi:hypothetical protein